MILSGSAVQTKSLGLSLVLTRKRLMAAWRSTRDSERAAFQLAYRELSEEALDGIELGGRLWRVMKQEAGWRSSQNRTS